MTNTHAASEGERGQKPRSIWYQHDAIVCPHCHYKVTFATDAEFMYPHTTYHGDGDARVIQCGECEESFIVKEHVTREFSTFANEEQYNEEY